MKLYAITFFVLQLTVLHLSGQDKTEPQEDRYTQLEERYKKSKDSLSRLHSFIPAVSSLVLNNKQIEISSFNSLMSANSFRDQNGDIKASDARYTYLYNSLQLTYGVSKGARFNIGMDVNAIVGRIDRDRNSSPLKVFSSEVEGNSQYAIGVTSIGPRIRWRPFSKSYRFTLQSSVLFPTLASAAKKNILGQNQIYLTSQLLYNQPLSRRMFFFTQLGIQYGLKSDAASPMLVSPVSGYLSYFIPKRAILFALVNYIPIFKKQDDWTYTAYTSQAGGGIQYYISKDLLANLFYANDVSGKSYQDFASYNISLRLLID